MTPPSVPAAMLSHTTQHNNNYLLISIETTVTSLVLYVCNFSFASSLLGCALHIFFFFSNTLFQHICNKVMTYAHSTLLSMIYMALLTICCGKKKTRTNKKACVRCTRKPISSRQRWHTCMMCLTNKQINKQTNKQTNNRAAAHRQTFSSAACHYFSSVYHVTHTHQT
jgi:hypothetical protein